MPRRLVVVPSLDACTKARPQLCAAAAPAVLAVATRMDARTFRASLQPVIERFLGDEAAPPAASRAARRARPRRRRGDDVDGSWAAFVRAPRTIHAAAGCPADDPCRGRSLVRAQRTIHRGRGVDATKPTEIAAPAGCGPSCSTRASCWTARTRRGPRSASSTRWRARCGTTPARRSTTRRSASWRTRRCSTLWWPAAREPTGSRRRRGVCLAIMWTSGQPRKRLVPTQGRQGVARGPRRRVVQDRHGAHPRGLPRDGRPRLDARRARPRA